MKYRNEIKIPISKNNESIYYKWLFSLKKIRKHNEIREINNIYYDTINFNSAKNNIDGISNRIKYRVRWYKQGSVKSNCNIELKVKQGRLNNKIVVPTNLSEEKIIKKDFFDIVKTDLKKIKLHRKDILIQKFFPTVQNKYVRNYYIYDDLIRLTYDTNINYKNLRIQSINNWNCDRLNVLEIKFNNENIEKARELISKMPFVPKRHSKYLRGLSHCKMAMYF